MNLNFIKSIESIRTTISLAHCKLRIAAKDVDMRIMVGTRDVMIVDRCKVPVWNKIQK